MVPRVAQGSGRKWARQHVLAQIADGCPVHAMATTGTVACAPFGHRARVVRGPPPHRPCMTGGLVLVCALFDMYCTIPYSNVTTHSLLL